MLGFYRWVLFVIGSALLVRSFEIRHVVIDHMDGILNTGNATALSDQAANVLLSARKFHLKYLILRDLDKLSSLESKGQLAFFMKEATAIGVEVVATGKSSDDFDMRNSFCKGYFADEEPCFSFYLMDFPFWDMKAVSPSSDICNDYLYRNGYACNLKSAFAYWKAMMKATQERAPDGVLVRAYVGWPEGAQTAVDVDLVYAGIVEATDAIFLETFVENANNAFVNVAERLKNFEQVARTMTKAFGVSLVYSLQPEHMQQYMLDLSLVDMDMKPLEKFQAAEDVVINYPDPYFLLDGCCMYLLPFTYVAYDDLMYSMQPR